MKSGLSRRGILALVIYFLMITAICAPIAFNVGKARGAEALSAGGVESQIETDTRPDYARLIRARRAGAGCGGVSDPAIHREAIWEVICHPETLEDGVHAVGAETSDEKRLAAAHARRRSASAVEIAAAQTIAGNGFRNPPMVARLFSGATASDDLFTPAPPLSLALAPDIANANGSIAGSAGGAAAPAGGPPRAIIPGIQGPMGGDDPSVVVTPAPAALPLLLTGLFGFFFAARGGKR